MSLFAKKSLDKVFDDLDDPERHLKRELNAWDIAVMGVAVAVGAGIFSVGAQASAYFAGPSVIISFLLAAVICGLAVMNYAEFASSIPVSGSAFTFAYVSLGELVAWIIGWNLILEMFTAGSVISKYWGIYLRNAFELLNIDIATEFKLGSVTVSWPPVAIIAFFTLLLIYGTKMTSSFNSILTTIKVGITIFIVVAGAFYVRAENYHPFFPPSEATLGGQAVGVAQQSMISFISGSEPSRYGLYGLIGAAALVFMAFIGFDVVATAAEETKDPQKTIPRGIFGGLGLVTVLYVAVTVIVTGMVSYKDLAKERDPNLATAFRLVGAHWVGVFITLGILVGLTTVIMVLLLGLTRVIFAMSRDGLLPRGLSNTSKHGTPARLQIICSAFVAAMAAVADVGQLSEMINIGTLSAFVIVSFSVPVLRKLYPNLKRGFKVPFSPWIPIISGLLCIWLMFNLTVQAWLYFAVWMFAGVSLYFGYSYAHSRVQQDRHYRPSLARVEEGKGPSNTSNNSSHSNDNIDASTNTDDRLNRKTAADPQSQRSKQIQVLSCISATLLAIPLILVVIQLMGTLSGVWSFTSLPALLDWLLIIMCLPGLVVAHVAFAFAEKLDHANKRASGAPQGPDNGEQPSTRFPRFLLSLGYLLLMVIMIVAVTSSLTAMS